MVFYLKVFYVLNIYKLQILTLGTLSTQNFRHYKTSDSIKLCTFAFQNYLK